MGFGKDMIWGAATAAYQIEGGFNEDGKGLSVWDVFCEKPNVIKNGDSGRVACDHYHRYKEDVRLLKEMGAKSYRFSVSWPRVLPNGTGEVNPAGIKFYNDLIDELIANGIEPMLTLFHWDYPQALEDRGGWLNPDSPKWFAEYARVIAENFGDRVKLFATFNEPQVFMGSGYHYGSLAPGKKLSLPEFTRACFNVLLAHGAAVKQLRTSVPDCRVGYVTATVFYAPEDEDDAGLIAEAKKQTFSLDIDNFFGRIAFWCDPVFLGTLPQTEGLAAIEPHLPADYKRLLKEEVCRPLDFCGLNVYFGYRVGRRDGSIKQLNFAPDAPRTAMNWPITPESMYWGTKFIFERYGLPVYISENGLACPDVVTHDGAVHDEARIKFMHDYISELERAADEGADVAGYYAWSFMDNFEWNCGYGPRFGLVHIDYATQKRTPKDSYYAYRDFIKRFYGE